MRYFEIAKPSAGYILADAADKSLGELKRVLRKMSNRQRPKSEAKPKD